MEASLVFFMMFVTGLYGSVIAMSVNEINENKKRKKKKDNDVIISILKDVL